VFAGYFVFEAADLDAAIELAARVPAARMGGTVEVRPVVEYPAEPQSPRAGSSAAAGSPAVER
jgi:hypothetical protein